MKLLSKELFFLPALLWLAMLPLQAQAQVQQIFTLEECIQYAIENNVNVKNERLNQGIARAQKGETMAQGLPQISGSGNYTRNLEIQRQYLQDFISPSVYGVLEAENLVEPDPARQFGYFPAQFGVPHSASGSVSVNQLIFKGSYFVGLRASKVFKDLAEKNVIKARIDVAEGVALAYYGALVSQERLELLEANLNRLDSLYRETKAMNEQGFVELIDVQRIKVNLNNLKTELNNLQRSYAINLNALKFQMGLPLDQAIELAQNIEDFADLDKALVQDFTYQDRIEYKQLNINRELAGLDIKNTQSGYLPSLTAFGTLGWNAGKPEFGQLFEETPDISVRDEDTGVESVIEANTWNRFASVGINLNVPIFDGLLKANTIRRKKLAAKQVENQIQNLEQAIELEIEQARITLINSLQSLENQQENRELAKEVFRVTKIKYQEGVGSNLEVVEAESALKEAETNYFQSLYDALVARVAYEKATGTLLQQ